MQIINKIEEIIMKTATLYNGSKSNVLILFIIAYLDEKNTVIYVDTDNELEKVNKLFYIFDKKTIKEIETIVYNELYIKMSSYTELFLEELEANGILGDEIGKKLGIGNMRYKINQKGIDFIINTIYNKR